MATSLQEKKNGKVVLYHKYYEQQVIKNVWTAKKYQSEFNGTKVIKDLFNGKNIFLISKICSCCQGYCQNGIR